MRHLKIAVNLELIQQNRTVRTIDTRGEIMMVYYTTGWLKIIRDCA